MLVASGLLGLFAGYLKWVSTRSLYAGVWEWVITDFQGEH